MKKLICVLAALLLVALLPTAALSGDLYDQYGPIGEWGEKEWQSSEEWSSEQWDEYLQDLNEAYEIQWIQQKRETLVEMGAPDPDGVNVKLNADFLLFTSYKPLFIEREAYLPLRSFLAVAGVEAEISYDAISRSATVTLADQSEQVFTVVDSPSEEEEEIYYSYASYDEARLVDGVMYVPGRGLCNFLGWDNKWDYNYDILYIIDPEPLIAAIDSNFTLANRLLGGSLNLDMEQSYSITESFSFWGSLYGEESSDDISASISLSGLGQGQNIDIDFSVQLDIKQMQDSLFSGFSDEVWRILKTVSAGKGHIIINSEQGLIFLQSNMLPLFDKRLSATDWLKLDLNASGLDTLLSGDFLREQTELLSIGRFIYQSYGDFYFGESDIYAKIIANAKLWQALLGDENFTQTHNKGYDVFSLDIKNKSVPGNGLPNENLLSMFGYYNYDDSANDDDTKANGALSFREKEGRLEDMDIKASIQTSGMLPVTYTLDYSSNSTKYQGNLEIKGRYIGKLRFNIEYEAKPTAQLPAALPPAGSRVVDWQSLNSERVYSLL